jgi:flagellar biosynthetic protein FliR
MTVPVFDSKNIPVFFKAGLAFAISIILFPILKLDNTFFTTEAIPFGIGVIGEIMLGIIIGLSVRLIFAGVQLAGQVAGYQMGFAIANIMDPVESSQIPVIAALKNIVAMLIFLAVNAHHWFLRSLVDSFQLIPPFGFHFTDSLMAQLVRLGGNMFVIAIKVGAPIIAVMLLTSVAFGLVARTVPQMHIFIVAIPIKILIGLLFLGFSLPILSLFLRQIFNGLGRDILLLLRAMS